MPHITVTIPVFNRSQLIGQTIESVLNQEFQDFDLLVVDDASSDDTIEIVRQYSERDPRIQFVVNPKNLGLTRNWNRCLDLAQGPLVQLLLSDDLIDPNYLGLVSNFFEKRPETGFVASKCRYVGPNGELIDPGRSEASRLYSAGDEAITALLLGGFPHVSSIVMRRECYEKLGKFNEHIWHGPDVEMDARIASVYDFYLFGDIHTSFRRHGSNMGCLEYLRNDFLEVDMLKKRLAWSYLSPDGFRAMGITNLEEFLAQNVAQAALTGATITVGYGRPDLSRYYLRKGIRLDSQLWRRRQFWKVLILLFVPFAGTLFMRHRMGVTDLDYRAAKAVETSLKSIATGKA